MTAGTSRTEQDKQFVTAWVNARYQQLTGHRDLNIRIGDKLRRLLANGCNWHQWSIDGDKPEEMAPAIQAVGEAMSLFNIR